MLTAEQKKAIATYIVGGSVKSVLEDVDCVGDLCDSCSDEGHEQLCAEIDAFIGQCKIHLQEFATKP